MIKVNHASVKLPPPYFACLLYANHIGDEVLKSVTSSLPVVLSRQLCTLDAVATGPADRHTLYLAVVNPSEDKPVSAHIRVRNWTPAGSEMQVYELNGKSWDAFNPYGSVANMNIRQRMFDAPRATFAYRFPSKSATVLELHGRSLGAP